MKGVPSSSLGAPTKIMKKEKTEQKGVKDFLEGGLAGPVAPSERNLDTINVDNTKGTPQEFTGENFDSLVEIYKLLNSPDAETRLRIEYGRTENGKKTATIFVDGQQYYFTDSEKEVENFHTWSKNKQERRKARNKRVN